MPQTFTNDYRRPYIGYGEPIVYNHGVQWYEVKDFTTWCLLTQDFFYDMEHKSWFDSHTLNTLTWEEIWVKYIEHKNKNENGKN